MKGTRGGVEAVKNGDQVIATVRKLNEDDELMKNENVLPEVVMKRVIAVLYMDNYKVKIEGFSGDKQCSQRCSCI